MNSKEIGNRIAAARKKMGIESQVKLAQILKCTSQLVQMYEAGKLIPPYKRVEQMAQLFQSRLGEEYSEQWILFGEESKQAVSSLKPHLIEVDDDTMDLVLRIARGAKRDWRKP